MNCLLCGEVCNCVQETASAPLPRWVTDTAVDQASAGEAEGEPSTDTTAVVEHATAEGSLNGAPASNVQTEETGAWRDELANRLSSYRARRKPRPPRYPSLRLAFDQPVLKASGPPSHAGPPLNQFRRTRWRWTLPGDAGQIFPTRKRSIDPSRRRPASAVSQTPPAVPRQIPSPAQHREDHRVPAIRLGTSLPLSLDELAEPVSDRPRILEVPEDCAAGAGIRRNHDRSAVAREQKSGRASTYLCKARHWFGA